ncbi:pentapeptide repeat-containing protein [Holosporaceae bacterium 'Namur']|nr:pentapeptide repeat-containing protein [Holosporaceae bacterium 'Namur']
MPSEDIRFTIDKYLESLNFNLTKDNLLYCLETFTNNRKNLTISGKVKIQKTSFIDQDIRGIDLNKFDITQARFINTKVDKEQFNYILTYAKKGLTDIRGIDIKGLDLIDLNLYNIDFTGVSFEQVKLDRKNIISLQDQLKNKKVNLRGADLQGVDLSGGYIVDNELGFNSYCYFDLEDMDFNEVNLQYANLSGAKLNRSNFEGANLNNAKIVATYARYTNMKRASMVGAILKYSDFYHSNFDFANLSNARV